jgi:CP family cyanate transporter-like MFS transporter
MLSLLVLASVLSTLLAPMIATRRQSQFALALGVSTAMLLGVLGYAVTGLALAPLFIVLIGLGSGGVFSLALLFVVLRAPDAEHTGALSGMAQSFGYLLAAAGPAGVGVLHDVTGSWDGALGVLVGLCALSLLAGMGASRDVQVSGRPGAGSLDIS